MEVGTIVGYKIAALDNKAYVSEEAFKSLLKERNLNEMEVSDSYDMVIHLVTAADGAVEHYTTENNSARIETPEEAIEVEKTTQLVEEAEETVEIPKEEIVETPEVKEVETPELNNAFGTTPTDNTEINENIVVEEPQEYTGEKTEIFDFPDFSDIPGGEEVEEEKDIDKEIIKVAEEYVSSVMHR